MTEPKAKYSDIISDGGLDPRRTFDVAPQREWQVLTDAEAEQIVDDYWHDVDMFIEAIESKLKEKNYDKS